MAEIKPINEELVDILAGFAKQTLGTNVEESVVVAATTPTEPEKVETPVDTPAAATPATPEVKKEEPKKEEKKEEVSTSFDDWDTPATEAPVTPTATTSELSEGVLIELAKVLGIEKPKGKDEVVNAISSLKLEAEKAKGVEKPQIRPELQKAIELDQKGGDFYEYLKVTSVDYSKADPTQLYEDYVIDSLADKDGNVDVDKVNEYLDNIPELEKELRGKDLQKRLVAEQARKVAEIEAQASYLREQNDAKLRAALGSLAEIDGFKVDDSHRKETFEWITSGKMMKDLFYGADGNLDPIKAAKVAFRNRYYEKLDAYHKNKIRNATKREILAETTNAQITSPSIPANPGPTKNGYDINDYIKSLEQNMFNK